MTNIKFNAKQLKNPTPSKISNAINVFTVIAGVIIGWIGTADFVPIHTTSVVQSILGLLLGIANGIKPFFGVETTKESVPIEEVTAMDSK